MNNKTVSIDTKKIINYATMVGGAVIGARAIVELTKVTSAKSAIWPIVTLFVGVVAFTAAVNANKAGTSAIKTV